MLKLFKRVFSALVLLVVLTIAILLGYSWYTH